MQTSTLSEAEPGVYSGKPDTSVSGVYRVLVRASGADLRGTRFTREELRTLAVWARGDDAPPVVIDPGSGVAPGSTCTGCSSAWLATTAFVACWSDTRSTRRGGPLRQACLWAMRCADSRISARHGPLDHRGICEGLHDEERPVPALPSP